MKKSLLIIGMVLFAFTLVSADEVILFDSQDGSSSIDCMIEDWSSGSTITEMSDDSEYGYVLEVIPGEGWGASSSCVAFRNIGDYRNEYESISFKMKSEDLDAIVVKVPEVERTFEFSDAENLGNGWYEVVVPFSVFRGTQRRPDQIGILGGWSKGGTFYITDVQLNS